MTEMNFADLLDRFFSEAVARAIAPLEARINALSTRLSERPDNDHPLTEAQVNALAEVVRRRLLAGGLTEAVAEQIDPADLLSGLSFSGQID